MHDYHYGMCRPQPTTPYGMQATAYHSHATCLSKQNVTIISETKTIKPG